MITDKVKIRTFNSKADFDKEVEKIISIQYKIETLEAELNQALEYTKLEYAELIEPLKIKKESIVASIFGWVLNNRFMLFGKKKSARCATGSYGLKKAKTSLQLINEDTEENDIAKMLFDKGKDKYIKVTFKLDKTAIKKAMEEENHEDIELLETYFENTQGEEFFVKPDDESKKIEE